MSREEIAAWRLRAQQAEARVKDLTEREDRQTGSWNTLANCADTLRARDFGTEFGAIDERVIAMAKALDAWRATAEELREVIEWLQNQDVTIKTSDGKRMFVRCPNLLELYRVEKMLHSP